MTLEQVTITNQGLLNLNRKIINSRKFNSNLITNVGTTPVAISDGSASEFNHDSYLYKGDLEFRGRTNDTISIIFEGTYVSSPNNSKQTAWYLSGSNNRIILQFVDNSPQLMLPSGNSITFDYLELADGVPFKIITNLSSNGCKILVDLKEEVYTEEILGSLNLSDYNSISIGNNPGQLSSPNNYFWEGSINLTNFEIRENNSTIYTPTDGYNLQLKELVVSDGKYTMTNEGIPPTIVNHLYRYEISQTSRSSNTLLLTVQLNSKDKLVVREIGLYVEVDGQDILFGYIKNLSIDKSAEVPYDLIITVDLEISVVNVVGFPDTNSFILNKIEPLLAKNFVTARDATLYAITNLERLIRMNSLQPTSLLGSTIQSIGYNTPEVVYRVQKETAEQEDCYSAVQTYSKLYKNFKNVVKNVFSTAYFTYYGDLIITDDGEASDFSNNNYVEIDHEISNKKDWTFNAAFSTSNTTSDAENTILSLINFYTEGNNDEEDSYVNYFEYSYFLTLYTQEGNLIAKTSESDSIIVSNIENNKKYYIKAVYNNSEGKIDIFLSNMSDMFPSEPNATITDLPNVDIINNIFAGINAYYTESIDSSISQVVLNPFTDGTLFLENFSIKQANNNWSTLTEIVVQDTDLLQYYHLSDYSRLFYRVYDICNSNYYIDFTDETFKGNCDLIDFHNDKFSLCLKVDIKNYSSKVLLAKVDRVGNVFFKLEFIKTTGNEENTFNLKFSLLTHAGMKEYISPDITSSGALDYINAPILITLIKDGNTINIYRNNDYLYSAYLDYTEDLPIPTYAGTFLTNYLGDITNTNYISVIDPSLAGIDFTKTDEWTSDQQNTVLQYFRDKGLTYITLENIEEYVNNGAFVTGYAYWITASTSSTVTYTFKSVKREEAMYITGKYVKDIILIENLLEPQELYYITNLTDTNFRFSVEDNITNQ